VDWAVERYVDKCGNAGDLLVGVAVEKFYWARFFVVLREHGEFCMWTSVWAVDLRLFMSVDF